MANVAAAAISRAEPGSLDAAARDSRTSECARSLATWRRLKYTLALAMLFGLMLSPRLWLSERSYPLVSVWDGLPTVPAPWDWLVLGALVTALVAILAASRPRPIMLAFVILGALWSVWDQTRWQPWFYQYLGMFAVLALGPAPKTSDRSGARAECEASINACRLVVAALYFWSGIQKMNVVFAADVFPQIMEPVLRYLPAGWHEAIGRRGWEAACLECAIGLGLLVWPLRLVAVACAVAMHLLLLFCLGPWGLNWNSVIWPWNVAMIVFVVVLFGRARRVQPWHILWPQQCIVARAVLLLFGVMPLFNFFGRWDSYLSCALYSGNTPGARVYVSQEVHAHLSPEAKASSVWRADATPDDPCPYEVYLPNWALAEMNVPSYPAERVARGIAHQLAELPEKSAFKNEKGSSPHEVGPRVPQVILIVQGRSDWRTGEREEKRVDFPDR